MTIMPERRVAERRRNWSERPDAWPDGSGEPIGFLAPMSPAPEDLGPLLRPSPDRGAPEAPAISNEYPYSVDPGIVRPLPEPDIDPKLILPMPDFTRPDPCAEDLAAVRVRIKNHQADVQRAQDLERQLRTANGGGRVRLQDELDRTRDRIDYGKANYEKDLQTIRDCSI